MRQSEFTGIKPANDNRDQRAIADLFATPPSIGIDFGRGDYSTMTLVHPGGTVEFIDEDDPRFHQFVNMAIEAHR